MAASNPDEAPETVEYGDERVQRGPDALEAFHFREKIFHFDHERIPERAVHARGYGVHGYFENLRAADRADPGGPVLRGRAAHPGLPPVLQ